MAERELHEGELEGLPPEEQLAKLNPHHKAPRRDGWKLLALCLATGVLIGVVLFWRAHQTAATDRAICLKVDRLDAALVAIITANYAPARPGEPLFDYYAHHPRERATLVGGQSEGLRKALGLLIKAACDPDRLPAVRGSP